jgi:SAM-dependent methyltransferase
MSTHLYDLAPTTRFTDRAESYALGRPSYAPAAIARILDGLSSPRVLDAGAGTGIATRLLTQAGARVIAFDPNYAMAAASGRHVSALARAEEIPFPDSTFDVVTVFNAFHWMRPDRALPEMRRVLRGAGRLALVWNGWEETHDGTAAFVRILNAFAGDHPPENRAMEVAPLYASEAFSDVVCHSFPYVHTLDRDTLMLRVQSISYLPAHGEVITRVQEYFERYAVQSAVQHHYVTTAFVAKRAAA